MAIAASYVLNGVTVNTSSGALYTVPSAGANTNAYLRDLVLTNAGTTSIFLSLGTGATSAATTSSFVVPTGGSVILTQCQVPAGGIVFGVSPGSAGALSVGYATNVAYI